MRRRETWASTATASSPLYMMSTQPSLLARTKRLMSAWPRLSKLYLRFLHRLLGKDRQSALVVMFCSDYKKHLYHYYDFVNNPTLYIRSLTVVEHSFEQLQNVGRSASGFFTTRPLTWTPRMPKMRKKVQQMRTMFPMGLSEMRRDWTTSFSPGAL